MGTSNGLPETVNATATPVAFVKDRARPGLEFQSISDEEYMNDNWTMMVYVSADDVLANFAIDSLNQLRRAAGDGNIVMAQFDPNIGGSAFRFRFDGQDNDKPLKDVQTKIGPVDMGAPDTLTEFVDWASGPLNESEGRHYCLILWGHGTELLLDQDPTTKRKRYLTPAKLRQALDATQFGREDKQLDIVGFDACSMSMIELASELQDRVSYMIASQEEVPDASFPYDKILPRLKDHGGDVVGVCKMIPELYRQSFRDYLITPSNGMKEITLASLNLETIKNITDPVQILAGSLLHSVFDKSLSDAIVLARQRSRDFVLGLFVDLYDFCHKLPESLIETGYENKEISGKLMTACEQIRNAISNKECIVANETRENEKTCHGLSIYFPYSVQEDESQQTKRLLGGAETGIANLPLVKGGTNITRKARNGRIEELEADFKDLQFFQEDEGWGTFIRNGWSLVLARKFPGNLDLHYSAEQCALNLARICERKPQIVPKTSEKGTHTGPETEYPRAG